MNAITRSSDPTFARGHWSAGLTACLLRTSTKDPRGISCTYLMSFRFGESMVPQGKQFSRTHCLSWHFNSTSPKKPNTTQGRSPEMWIVKMVASFHEGSNHLRTKPGSAPTIYEPDLVQPSYHQGPWAYCSTVSISSE